MFIQINNIIFFLDLHGVYYSNFKLQTLKQVRDKEKLSFDLNIKYSSG